MEKHRRTLKKVFSNNHKKMNVSTYATILLVASMALFVSTQLITSAILTPLGHKLASLNNEKNLLIEENRELEQDIAKNTSLTIVNKYSEGKLELTKTDNSHIVYVTTDVQASL